jgi:hypothetical protein
MTVALANLTQVLSQSPQVSALAGGHLAAEEVAVREAQRETSQRLREVLARTVSPADEARVVAAIDPQLRRENRRPRPAGPRTGGDGPSQDGHRRGALAAPGLFDPRPVIDVRI